jgi:branched-chain amino acid transport system substrate-binding protein
MGTRPLGAIAAMAATVLALACGSRPDRVVIGIGMATNVRIAAELAAGEINAAGGIHGVPVELSGLDGADLSSPFDPAEVLASAGRFIETGGLVAVVGHSDSATTISAAPAYNRAGVPQVVAIATNPAITNIGAWTYRICLSDARQGPALADYVVKDLGRRRIALLFVNDDYGRGLAERFEARVREVGADIVLSVAHRNVLQSDDEEVIRLAIGGMRDQPPDAIALFQRLNAARWTLEALREAGVDADLVGGDNLAQNALLAFDERLTRNLRVSQFFHLDAGNPRTARFADRYRAEAGVDPDYSQAFTYDAIHLVADAVRAKGFSRAAVKAYLDGLIATGTTVEGAGGSFTLGADHDAVRPLFVAEVREGRFQIVKAVR